MNYSLFIALKDHHDGKPWNEWEKEISQRNTSAVKQLQKLLKDEIEYHKFVQVFIFQTMA